MPNPTSSAPSLFPGSPASPASPAAPREAAASPLTRRAFLGAVIAAPLLAPGVAAAQQAPAGQRLPIPPEHPRDWSGREPTRYPDPDIVALDARFRRYIVGNTVIKRLYTGAQWSEGPAWNGVGRYLVWSDIPNNRQLRYIEDDDRVTVFRTPSGNSNGNTFDFEGRQLSCEHGGRRVVRYEYNGTTTVIAERYQGKRLNSPNDVTVHQDGSIWFTDPQYGIRGNFEGNRAESENKPGVYRADPKTGQLDLVTDELTGPNGICFSPDYKRLYICDTGSGRDIRVMDVDGKSARNLRRHVALTVPGSNPEQLSAGDGLRCDIDGNIWTGARPGVQIIAPDGVVIGMIRLPENCANVCFGGQKRNRLFMAASQSLYAVHVETQGAGVA